MPPSRTVIQHAIESGNGILDAYSALEALGTLKDLVSLACMAVEAVSRALAALDNGEMEYTEAEDRSTVDDLLQGSMDIDTARPESPSHCETPELPRPETLGRIR
ncbi:hypothetical protein FRB90_002212, partial [Tulasnella sp. 427]